jgi:hypothetical protein
VLSNAVSGLSQAVSVLSVQLFVTISNAVSVLSQAVSVLSQSVSALSQAASVLSVQLFVTLSQQVSVLSQQLSVLSQAVSALSQAVSALSQAVSALSQAVSAAGGFTLYKNTADQAAISATVGGGTSTTVSGLRMSMAAGATYAIDGIILYTTSTSNNIRIGFSSTNGMVSAGYIAIDGFLTVIAIGATYFTTAQQFHGEASAATFSSTPSAIVSLLAGASSQQHYARVRGLIQTTGTPGTMEPHFWQSLTASLVTIKKDSWLRVYKIA